MSSEIRFLQNNVGRVPAYMVTCLEIGLELDTDFILFQEPYIYEDNTTISPTFDTISHPAYDVILPSSSLIRPRVAIFHRKLSRFRFCQRDDLSSSDLLVIDILGSQIPDLQLINIYNEKSLEPDIDTWTIERSLVNLVPSKNSILGGDFNAHHSWWNSTISSPLRAENLTQWLQRYGFDLISQPDQSTFYREGMTSLSVIDLVFISQGLSTKHIEWEMDQGVASGSDHQILLYSIVESDDLVENPAHQMLYNLEKADWKAFSQKLLELDQRSEYRWDYQEVGPSWGPDIELDFDLGLEKEATKLQDMIKAAAEASIPRKKAFSRSKAWWTKELTSLRRQFGKARKAWKGSPNQDTYRAFLEARNSYFQEVKIAKTSCWNTFLENAQGREIYKAFSYTKKKLLPRLPVLSYEGNHATSFPDKCQAFMGTLFKKPPSADPIDWNSLPEHSRWSSYWPDIRDREIKNAIFESSIKKAPGPDEISFLIVQKAYQNLESRFNRLYRILIRKGYHPRCWKTAKGVILKKSSHDKKRDYTMPKSYRVVSLLNCLGKVSEKILAKRLAELSELPDSDLLYYDQMGSRPKKSALDSVLSLVHDVQMAQHQKMKTSTIFLDVKGAFDHVAVHQLLRICNKLGLPRSLIRWIYSFMSNRKIKLAFNRESSKLMPINIGIPQGSPISPILFAIYVRYLYDFSNAGDKRSTLEAARYLSYVDDNSITISSDSYEKNYRILKQICDHLIEKGKANHILFDHDKTELIQFFPSRSIDLEDPRFMVKIGEKEIRA